MWSDHRCWIRRIETRPSDTHFFNKDLFELELVSIRSLELKVWNHSRCWAGLFETESSRGHVLRGHRSRVCCVKLNHIIWIINSINSCEEISDGGLNSLSQMLQKLPSLKHVSLNFHQSITSIWSSKSLFE